MPATEVLSLPIKQGSDPVEVIQILKDLPVIGKIFTGRVNGKPYQYRAFLGSIPRDFAVGSILPLTFS